MSRIRWRSILATILIAGCYRVCPKMEEHRIDRWLTCDECIDGERAAVLAMGQEAVPALKAALVGPSDARREVMKAKFADSYSVSPIAGLSQSAYVDSLHSNYVATYQKRAATALGDIGGSEAVAALQQAVQDSASRSYRTDVVQVVTFVNARLSFPHFGGTIRPGRVSFGDTITVVAAQGRPFSGISSASIVDAAFPPAQIPQRRSGDTLRFSAVAGMGSHVVAVAHGTGARSEVAGVTIGSLLDPNDRAIIVCADADSACAVSRAPFIGPSFPFTTFLALWNTPPRADNVDYLRLEAGGTSLTVTATLEWKGNANLDMFWKRCSPFTAIVNPTGATNALIEKTTEVIPAGQCRVLLVVMRPDSIAIGPAFARLQVTSP